MGLKVLSESPGNFYTGHLSLQGPTSPNDKMCSQGIWLLFMTACCIITRKLEFINHTPEATKKNSKNSSPSGRCESNKGLAPRDESLSLQEGPSHQSLRAGNPADDTLRAYRVAPRPGLYPHGRGGVCDRARSEAPMLLCGSGEWLCAPVSLTELQPSRGNIRIGPSPYLALQYKDTKQCSVG